MVEKLKFLDLPQTSNGFVFFLSKNMYFAKQVFCEISTPADDDGSSDV